MADTRVSKTHAHAVGGVGGISERVSKAHLNVVGGQANILTRASKTVLLVVANDPNPTPAYVDEPGPAVGVDSRRIC